MMRRRNRNRNLALLCLGLAVVLGALLLGAGYLVAKPQTLPRSGTWAELEFQGGVASASPPAFDAFVLCDKAACDEGPALYGFRPPPIVVPWQELPHNNAPEPGTLTLLAVGALMLRKRR